MIIKYSFPDCLGLCFNFEYYSLTTSVFPRPCFIRLTRRCRLKNKNWVLLYTIMFLSNYFGYDKFYFMKAVYVKLCFHNDILLSWYEPAFLHMPKTYLILESFIIPGGPRRGSRLQATIQTLLRFWSRMFLVELIEKGMDITHSRLLVCCAQAPGCALSLSMA